MPSFLVTASDTLPALSETASKTQTFPRLAADALGTIADAASTAARMYVVLTKSATAVLKVSRSLRPR